MELFNAGRFQAANGAFAKLVSAPNRDLAHSAEVRMKICEQRLSASKQEANAESE
jgi:cytochrome c-type biogenesis protein CcmH/NrfG